MRKKSKPAGLPISVLLGAIGALILAITISFLIAWIISIGIIPQSMCTFIVPIIIAGSVFTASFFTARSCQKNQRIPAALGVSAIYIALCLMAKILLFTGNFQNFLRNSLIAIGAALLAFIVSTVEKKRKVKYNVKRRW